MNMIIITEDRKITAQNFLSSLKKEIMKISTSCTLKIETPNGGMWYPELNIKASDKRFFIELISLLKEKTKQKIPIQWVDRHSEEGLVIVSFQKDGGIVDPFLDSFKAREELINESTKTSKRGEKEFESFKKLIQKSGGVSGKHYKSIVQTTNPLILTIYHNEDQPLEPVVQVLEILKIDHDFSPKSKNAIKVFLSEGKNYEVLYWDGLEQFWEFKKQGDNIVAQNNIILVIEKPQIEEMKPASISAMVTSVGTIFENLPKEDQIIFLKIYGDKQIEERLRNELTEKIIRETTDTLNSDFEDTLKLKLEENTNKTISEFKEKIKKEINLILI